MERETESDERAVNNRRERHEERDERERKREQEKS